MKTPFYQRMSLKMVDLRENTILLKRKQIFVAVQFLWEFSFHSCQEACSNLQLSFLLEIQRSLFSADL